MSRIYDALQKAESEKGSGAVATAERKQELKYARAAVAELHPALPAADVPEMPLGGFAAAVNGRLSGAVDVGAVDLGAVPARPWAPSLRQLPALMERGPGVEQFRSLRARIQEMRDLKPLKSILISSGLPQEGKSFVAANLAISLARNKHSKVLLIDGDMRRYTLHQILGCDSEPGLSEYLAGKATVTEVMQRPDLSQGGSTNGSGMRKAGFPAITFIAGGNGGDKAADLSGNHRFEELIGAVSPMFDWIVVDSSPVLPVSDAVNLARACDGVLLVARGGVTDLTTAQRAQSELKASNLLGFVLNAVVKAPQLGTYYGYDREKA